MGILSTPFEDKILQKVYPNSGETKAADIVQYEITYFCSLMIAVGVYGYIFLSIGRMLFGKVSYNVTYDIRKTLYESILVKNIGYFDFPENAVPVLSSVMQTDTTIINGVATEAIPPQVEAGTLVVFAVLLATYFCW